MRISFHTRLKLEQITITKISHLDSLWKSGTRKWPIVWYQCHYFIKFKFLQTHWRPTHAFMQSFLVVCLANCVLTILELNLYQQFRVFSGQVFTSPTQPQNRSLYRTRMTAKWTKPQTLLQSVAKLLFSIILLICKFRTFLCRCLLAYLGSLCLHPKLSSVGIRLSEAENYCGIVQYFGHPIAHEQLRLSHVYKASIRLGLFLVQNIFPEIL